MSDIPGTPAADPAAAAPPTEPTAAPAAAPTADPGQVPAPAATPDLINNGVTPPAADPAPGAAPIEPVIPTRQTLQDMLPEHLREDTILGRYDTLESLSEAFINQRKTLSGKGLAVPAEDATQEEWNAFYSNVGRPDSIDGYNWESPVNEQGEPLINIEDQGAFNDILQGFWDKGATPEQVNYALDLYANMQNQSSQELAQYVATQKTEAIQTLENEWGDQFISNMDTVNAVVAKFGLQQDLHEMGAANNLKMIKLFHAIAPLALESSIKGDGTNNSLGGAHSFNAELAALEKHPAYNDAGHPEHRAVMEKRSALYKTRYG